MRHWGFACAILLSLYGLSACRSKPVYKFPTDENKLWSPEVANSQIRVFEESYKRFAYENAEILAKSNDSFDFPVVSSYQTGLALLNATEGESYAAAARFMRTDEPDEFNLNQGFGKFLNFNDHCFEARSSLWMIWPIQVDISYQREMAGRFKIDTIRLGSTGITAQNAVKRWMDRFPPDMKKSKVELIKSNQMIGLGGSVFIKDYLTHPLLKSGTSYKAFENKEAQFEIFFWEPKPDQFMSDIDSLAEQKWDRPSANVVANIPDFKVDSQLDLTPLIRATQSERLLDGKNDFRHLSVELIDEAGVPVMKQFTYAKIKFDKKIVSGDKPLGYAICVRGFVGGRRMPIIIGKIAPNKQK